MSEKKPVLQNSKTVAATMGVHQHTVTEAARLGRYRAKRTPGGHYRIEVDEDGWPIEAKERKK